MVILQKNTLHTDRIPPHGISADIFKEVLFKMRVSRDVLDRIVLRIEFRYMVPKGLFVARGEYEFEIYINELLLDNTQQLNWTTAHELKHLTYEVLKPKRTRTDKKRKGPYKWEEVNCERAGRRFRGEPFFLFS